MADNLLESHLNRIQEMYENGTFKRILSENEIKDLAQYFCSLPDEAAWQLWHLMGKGAVQNTIALHQFKQDGVTIGGKKLQQLLANGDHR